MSEANSDLRGIVNDKPKFIIFDRSEGLLESVLSNAITFFRLTACVLVVYIFDGGLVWQVVTLALFIGWVWIRLPWESATQTRTLKLRGKKEAVAWAQSLPDDADQGRQPTDGTDDAQRSS